MPRPIINYRLLIIPGYLAFCVVTLLCGCRRAHPGDTTPIYTYEVIDAYPHDAGAFTQGLVFENGILYESTGLLGRSSLREVDLATGKVLQIHNLPSDVFGEGIAVVGDKIIQLTLDSNIAIIYDKATLKPVQKINYPRKGWGLAFDGKNLIASDGSSTLYLLDPNSLEETGRIEVRDSNTPVGGLNELEYIDGQIYANIWLTDRIAIISPATGQITAWLDLAGLLKPYKAGIRADVLNGIACDPAQERLFVTGKLWPKLFHIKPSWKK